MASKNKPKIRTVKDLKNKLKIDFVSSEVLNRKDEKNRINYILEVVKDGTILVTDGVMNPDEELSLIRETMRRVDSGFPGIEVCSLKRETRGYQRLLENIFDQRYNVEKLVNRITGRSEPRMDMKYGMTLIGPSKFIKDIKKNPDSFSVLTEMQK
jgi:hypothetical protein